MNKFINEDGFEVKNEKEVSPKKNKSGVLLNPTPEKVSEMEKEKHTKGELKPQENAFKKISKYGPKSVLVKLASGNKVVPENIAPNGEIQVRRYTLTEESLFRDLNLQIMRILPSAQENNKINAEIVLLIYQTIGKTLTSIIDNCLITDYPIGNIPIMDKTCIFIKTLIATYGNIHNIIVDDVSYTVDLEKLIFKPLPEDWKIPVFDLKKSYPDCNISIYMNIPKLNKEHIFMDINDLTNRVDSLIGKIVDDGEEIVDRDDRIEIINNLHSHDIFKIEEYFKEINQYGLRTQFVHEGELVNVDIQTILSQIINKQLG